MEMLVKQTQDAGWFAPSAYVAIVAIAISCAALLLLHFASPEFAPSWRMVSEYANGQHKWLLTTVFAGWALSSFALVAALWPLRETTLGKIGLLFMLLGGIGQTMGALFDINHKLHGPAAMIGIPALCIAAVLITLALARRSDIAAPPLWSAHLPWITFALMIGAFVLFFSSLKAAGVDMSGQSRPLEELPTGVNGYVGWANRLLFATSYLWAALTSVAVIQASTGTAN
ncbi:MAG: DUF998 domain-containing protein [Reyranella sp.]|nr:DUF998 domain-containing protein [Reyranella sp.]